MDYSVCEILYKKVNEWISDGFGTYEDNIPVFAVAGERFPLTGPEELSKARKAAQKMVNLRFMERGVDITDIENVTIHPDTLIGAGTVIHPYTVIRADVEIGGECTVGPFAYLRPGTRVGSHVKLGDFVEIKNSTLADHVSVSHLTYVGDADVGASVNFGCGTVTVNYDGAKKFRTVIGEGAFIGCNSNLIAPVTVGEGAYTAAGSTITENVPPQALGIGRARQVNKENWESPKRR